MKRLIAITLMLAMLLCTPAFAVGAGEHSTDVTATFVNSDTASSIVYSVDITWEDLEFTYYEASAPTWDPVNHKYLDDGQAEGWAATDKASVEIVNHSNTDILATFSYEAKEGFEGAEMDFKVTELYIGSAEDGSEKSATNTVTPAGILPEGTEDDVIGSITIDIAKSPSVGMTDLDALRVELNALEEAYDIVEEPSVLESGSQYIWRTEFDEATVKIYECDYMIEEFGEGNVAQEKVNEAYYAAVKVIKNLVRTKQ